MLCSPLGPSSWKPWPSLGLHRARPADQRFNLPHPSFPTQAPKTQNENWWPGRAFRLARGWGACSPASPRCWCEWRWPTRWPGSSGLCWPRVGFIELRLRRCRRRHDREAVRSGRVTGEGWRYGQETGSGQPALRQARQARGPELDLIFGLPSGPAACEPHPRPHTCQHPTTCHTALEDFSCSERGVHTCRKVFGVYGSLSLRAAYAPPDRRWPMILNALAEKLKRRSKDGFKGRHYEASLILQAVSWYLRYPLSYRDIEELFLERGLEVDHSTLNRWVLAYAPLIERRLRAFRKPHCGSIRVDETYIKIRGQWRYLYRAIDKHGNPVDFLLTAKRDLDAAKRFFRKMLQDEPLLSPDRIGTDGAGSYPPAIAAARKDGLLARTPVHYITKHLQQGIESDHFRVKRPMPRVGGFQAFHTARRTIQGFEAMLWLRKGFGFAGAWTVCEQNRLLALCFGLPEVNKV